jgi:hypothetical protein
MVGSNATIQKCNFGVNGLTLLITDSVVSNMQILDSNFYHNCVVSAASPVALYSGASQRGLYMNNCLYSAVNPISAGPGNPAFFYGGYLYNCNIMNSNFIMDNFNANGFFGGMNPAPSEPSNLYNCNFTYGTGYGNTSMMCIAGVCTNCTFNMTNDNSHTIYVNNNSSSQSVAYASCTFNGNFQIANGVSVINLFSNCLILKGGIQVTQPTYIPGITANSASITNIPMGIGGVGSVLYVPSVNISGCPVTPNTASSGIQLNNNGKIFITKLDVSFTGQGNTGYNYLNFNSSEQAAIYVANEGGIPGNWSARSWRTSLLCSNTYRQGGKNYSLRGTSYSSYSSPTPYLWVAPPPFMGIPYSGIAAGNHTATLYLAYKNFNPVYPLIPTDIPMLIQCFNFDGSISNFSSLASGNLMNDSSTWINDSGLTIMALSVPFYVKNGPASISVNFGFYKYDTTYTTGYVVFDPGIIIV